MVLAMLWASALIIWGRFSLEKVVVIGNRAHVFVSLDEEDGHHFNNTKWFSKTRIHNLSELSELVKMVTTSTLTARAKTASPNSSKTRSSKPSSVKTSCSLKPQASAKASLNTPHTPMAPKTT